LDAILSTNPPSTVGAEKRADILLVDDDALVLRALERMLTSAGYTVERSSDGQAAARLVMSGAYDLVISDVHMPGFTGTELLDVVRSYGSDVPVILVTGSPTIDTAQAAVELGAVQYMTKPIERGQLVKSVEKAIRLGKQKSSTRPDPAETAGFERALGKLWMAYQPIVSLSAGCPIAYEALVRSDEPTFNNPGALLGYAEKSNRLPELGRAIRELCADAAARTPRGAALFVNLHPQDLHDAELFSPNSALASYAHRVVLEITERGALDDVEDAVDRIRRLRQLGFRIAIDDLGAGYAGLSSIAVLEPDFVKLDMSLTRDLGSSPVRMRLVSSMVGACRDVGMSLVAEGVETTDELNALKALGCDLLQGYHFARPAREFVKIAA
jgi:EAL domain-containing protein (putative c-di-GMP-specific phosphodiesterase class I)